MRHLFFFPSYTHLSMTFRQELSFWFPKAKPTNPTAETGSKAPLSDRFPYRALTHTRLS
ncbi:hypothetical protein C8R44DRAFT_199542 [Mycena epipterygia]|nr:hypothetical protein C8R44DRAFT_199542 [Mycena epipterygia]